MTKFRSVMEDPSVQAALKEKRPAKDIALLPCRECGQMSYYNEGSHFSCSVAGCGWSCAGRELDLLIEEEGVTSLFDFVGEINEGDIP